METNLTIQEIKFYNFSNLLNYIENHKAVNHPFFVYLNDVKNGFTANQYSIYRYNYFYRTSNTIPSIAHLVIAAAFNGDIQSLAFAGQNLYEETGCGVKENVHSKLLEDSYNSHAKKIFGLNPLYLKDTTSSSNVNVIKEACLFVEKQNTLYKSDNYCTVLGTALAHETLAVSMLTNFYKAFFLRYRGYYKKEEFDQVEKYFSSHLGGVEERHAKNSQEIVQRWCKNENDLHSIAKGAIGFMEAQSVLWDGLHRELKNAEDERIIIKFKILI